MSRAARLTADLLVAALAVAVVAYAAQGTFEYTLFTDRDLVRGARLLQDLPTAGAELSGGPGARVPGPALGVLFWLPRLASHDAQAVYLFQVGLFAAGLVVLHLALSRAFGPVAGVVAALAWATGGVAQNTLLRLWNPGFVPLFEAVALAALVRALVTGRAAWWVPLAGGVAVAAQLHLAILPLALGWLPALALARPEGARRGLAAAVGVVVLLYLPWLVDEAVHGARGVGALGGQDGLHPTTWDPARALGAVRLALDVDRLAAALPTSAVELAVGAVALAGLGATLVRGGPTRRVVAALLLGVATTVASLGVPVAPQLEYRYVAVLAAPLAALLGIGVQAALDGARARSLALAALVTVPVAGGLASACTRLPWLAGAWTWTAYAETTATLDAVRARTGWSLAEVAGRTTWRRVDFDLRSEDHVDWPPVDHLLLEQGAPWPGSLPPPCALVTASAPDPRLADPAVVGGLVRALAPVRVLEGPVDLGTGAALVLYAPSGDRCPTSMAQRYVDTPEEAALREAVEGRPCEQVVELPVAGGRRLGIAVDAVHPGDVDCRAVALAVTVTPAAGGLDVRLDSNQLRGVADNTGWLSAAALRDPVVELVGEAGTVRVPLVDGVLGFHGAVTPVVRHVDLPPGRYALALEAGMVDLFTSTDGLDRRVTWTPERLVATPFRRVLADDVEVPATVAR